jgi:hypothetical protein
MLSDPPPARVILARMRNGCGSLPSLVGGDWFNVDEVRDVGI